MYNSCGDRHCPLCAGAKRADWLNSTSELLLPGIKYFQVVFTIPDKLSSLALGNREAIYNLLFRSAWQTLREVIADEHRCPFDNFRWNEAPAAARGSSETVDFVPHPPRVTPCRASPQPTTAPIAATGIATARQIDVTSPLSPGRLHRPAE